MGWSYWDKTERCLPILLGRGRELLATQGPLMLRCLHAGPSMTFLTPLENMRGGLGYRPLDVYGDDPTAGKRYGRHIKNLQRWLMRKWFQASRVHPGLGGVRAWLVVNQRTQSNSHMEPILEDIWVRQMGSDGLAHLKDPRLLMEEMAGLDPAEIQDPRRWVGQWLDCLVSPRRGMTFASIPAARWWLKLDARTVVRLCGMLQPYTQNGILKVSTIAQIAHKKGGLSLSRQQVKFLERIPSVFWYAYWHGAQSQAWRRSSRESWGYHAASPRKGYLYFIEEQERARHLLKSRPRLTSGFLWAVGLVLDGKAGQQDIAPDDRLQERILTNNIWNWLWGGLYNQGMAAQVLSEADKSWTWESLKTRFLRWDEEQEYLMLVELAGPEKSGGEAPSWGSLVGAQTIEGVQIRPVLGSRPLQVVGKRFRNCLRNERMLEGYLKRARSNSARWFALRNERDKNGALVEIGRTKSGLWRVSQVTGWANSSIAPGSHLFDVSERIARMYTDSWRHQQDEVKRSDEKMLRPAKKDAATSKKKLDIAPESGPQEKDWGPEVRRHLRRWMEGRPTPLIFFKDRGSIPTRLTPEEVSSPDGFLSAWLDQVVLPDGLWVEYRLDSSSIYGARLLIKGNRGAVPKLLDELMRVWGEKEASSRESSFSTVDITDWSLSASAWNFFLSSRKSPDS